MKITDILKSAWSTGVVGTFITGLLVVLPLALTLTILGWLIGKLAAVIGPESLVGDLLLGGIGSFIGPNHSTLAYLLGLVIVFVAIWFIGLVVKAQAKRQINRRIDSLFERMPFIRSIYKPVSQMLKMVSGGGDSDIKSMQVVMCNFGHEGGADVLSLLTTPQVYEFGGERRQLVYLPTSPLPMSGALVFVPQASVRLVPNMSVDELMKIYLSLGALAPDIALARFDTFAKTPTE